MFGLDSGIVLLLILCVLACCAFEFINGFHDTANAVATVIYTNSLRPQVAVILSGTLNFLGVFAGGIGVAVGITNLLPADAMISEHSNYQGLIMVMSILFAAIFWNFGTWYYGIPCSSSHTLIGSILGVGIANSLLTAGNIENVNWSKATEIGMSLLISPAFGFGLTLLLMYVLRIFVKNQLIFNTPPEKKAPPTWIRAILILTCSGVSFSHGSNDGQKGVGLMMLILISIVPLQFALNSFDQPEKIKSEILALEGSFAKLNESEISKENTASYTRLKKTFDEFDTLIKVSIEKKVIPEDKRFDLRKDILLIGKDFEKIIKDKELKLSATEKEEIKGHLKNIKTNVDYAPFWVLLLISMSLGIGTTVGWKRIVETIGEKIGKEHLTYAQGASSELVAAGTISLSTYLGLPVSTTQVLSSGIAGSMVAGKGVSNLQGGTIRNIALAWLLTLPVCITVAGVIYWILQLLF